MKVRDTMAKTISCAQPQDTIQQVAAMMKKDDTGFIPVVANGHPVGVITDRDIVIRCLAEGHGNPLQETVEHVMTRDVDTISPDANLEAAGEEMAGDEVRRLAVVENGKLVGVLSHGNLVQATQGAGPARTATIGVTEGA